MSLTREHPSGLRDAIAAAVVWMPTKEWITPAQARALIERIEQAVVAYLAPVESTLHDVIAHAIHIADHSYGNDSGLYPDYLADVIDASLVAWLSVVSEDEIEAAARAILGASDDWDDPMVTEKDREWHRTLASYALAASRGVLIDRSSSGE